ncbi:MAG: hypothetical protein PHD83_06105 [Caldisericia bacterium]|nr:hypothetical protein [Caldisericia bacterium]
MKYLKTGIGILIVLSCILVTLPKPLQLAPQNKVWEDRSQGIDFGGVTCMAHHPDNNAVMMIGSKIKGLFISNNFTKRWKNMLLEKFERLWINCIAIDPHQHNKIIIGTQVGLFISDDFGSSWHERKFGTSVMQVFSIAFHPVNEQTLFVGTYEGGIIKSVDNGNSWTYLYKGNPHLDSRVTSLQINPANPSQIAASLFGKGVLVSENGGESWNQKNSGLYDLNIQTMKMDPIHPSTLYVGTLGGMFKSVNSGEDWLACNNGLTSVWKEIYSLIINPLKPDELYAGCNNGYVYHTKDGAKNWEALPQILSKDENETIWVYDLKLDPLHPTMLYAGTNSGVYRYRNTNAALTDSLLLEIENPVQNEIIRDSGVIIKGRATDTEFGIDRVIINQQTVLMDAFGNFEHRIPLQYGKNQMVVTAINNDDFMVSKRIEVFGIADETEPILCVFYPDSDLVQNVNRSSLNITGYATDPDSGIDTLTINHLNVPIDSQGEFNHMVILNRGMNTIEIEAVNCAGLKSTLVKMIYFEFSKLGK